jgi:septal ring-binding cell division protein DamX
MVKHIVLICASVISESAFAKERCVPDVNGEWRCGENITAADAAPLPKSENRTSAPPVYLIDPRRFGEAELPRARAAAQSRAVDANTNTESESAADSGRNNPVATVTQARATTTKAVIPAAPIDRSTSSLAEQATRQTSGAFTVQLALAGSTKGFDALLQQLRIAPNRTRRVALSNGMWALLYGEFDSLEAARSAIPIGANGAFARAVASLAE